MALRTEDQGAQASVHWVRKQDLHRVDLAGPFGGGRVRIVQNRDGAELRDSTGKVYRDATAQELLARVTGWRLPLNALSSWVVGLPSPEGPARIELDEWGRLRVLDQLGWEIRFLEYQQHGNLEVPRRLFIKSRSAQNAMPEAELRFAIDSWILPDRIDLASAPARQCAGCDDDLARAR